MWIAQALTGQRHFDSAALYGAYGTPVRPIAMRLQDDDGFEEDNGFLMVLHKLTASNTAARSAAQHLHSMPAASRGGNSTKSRDKAPYQGLKA